ncbi:hypothetical protein B0H66DRAFT_69880 [Apodospora peruviana]|uniref:Apple domain-containing protein n=1 Tax=Apodospora peruviana TaxID=516989 RepID=A0AAE0ITA7_9PEZI|nr:hypothetical protein B0H66DRAFT_69880 [Apodospora peruviana]
MEKNINTTAPAVSPEAHDPGAPQHAPEVVVQHLQQTPEVVQQPYPTGKPGTPTSVHSHQSTEPLGTQQQDQQTGWPQVGNESVPLPPQYPGAPATYPSGLEVPPVEESQAEPRILGVRRRLFLLLLALGGLVLLGIAIGVGVGVGVGNQNHKNEASSTVNVTPTSSGSGTAAAETGPVPAGAACPYYANTQYETPSGKKFLRLCGVDYSGPGEAKDISSERTPTFLDCLELCAKKESCTGAGWGPMLPERPARTTCWMKNSLNLSHIAPADWNFGIVLD